MPINWNKIVPRWSGDVIEPPESKKDTGYIAGDKPPAKWENWLRKGTYEALEETREVVEGIDTQLAEEVQSLVSHKEEMVSQVGGVHGFEIEKGTWTPSFEFVDGSVGVAVSLAEGFYVKQGNMITIICNLNLSNKGTSTGNARITNLPFAFATSTTNPLARFINLTLPSGTSALCVVGSPGLSRVNLAASGSGLGFIGIDETNITNTTGLRFTFQYITQ